MQTKLMHCMYSRSGPNNHSYLL